MSIQRYKATYKKFAYSGVTSDGEGLILVAPSLKWKQNFSATPAAVAVGINSFTSYNWTPSPIDYSTIHHIYLTSTAITTDAVNLFTFINVYKLLSQARLYINGESVSWLRSSYEIDAAVNQHYREYVNAEELIEEIQRQSVNTNPLLGDQITTTGTNIRIDMMVLFPFLKDIILNISGIRRLQFDITFNSDNGNLQNTYIGRSSTTANAYTSAISFQNLNFEMVYSQQSDASMLLPIPMNILPITQYHTFQWPNIDWTAVNSSHYLLAPQTAFPPVNRLVTGISIYLYDNLNSASAYNSATSAQNYSGSAYIKMLIRYGGSILYDTGEIAARREYDSDVYKARNHKNTIMPHNLVVNSDTMGKYFIHATYFDMSNIENDDAYDRLISGRNTLTNDITIDIVCAGAISTNCTLHAVLHYETLINLQQNGALIKV